MKKVYSTLLATAMAFGMGATAFAAPVYESEDVLKNTITGFSTGEKEYSVDVTQKGGDVKVSFGLGENASYYSVELDVVDGGRQLSAEYSKSKGEIVLRPRVDTKLTESQEFEVEIEVFNRKNKELVADGYTISGEVSYDEIQMVDSDSRYNNSKGVLYDFGEGAENVEIYASKDVTLNFAKTGKGIVNLDLNGESNEAIDTMFSEHELEYINFVSKPKFNSEVEVTIESAESHLYEYANGKISKVGEYEEGVGYTFKTKQLATYILADMPLTEGEVDENIQLVKPEQGGSNTGDKNNPTTGAADLSGVASALAVLSLAGAAAVCLKKSK